MPFVGVDEQFPIEDPFSGQFFGFLQIRIAVGTAEQVMTNCGDVLSSLDYAQFTQVRIKCQFLLDSQPYVEEC